MKRNRNSGIEVNWYVVGTIFFIVVIWTCIILGVKSAWNDHLKARASEIIKIIEM